jgi:cytochrome c5
MPSLTPTAPTGGRWPVRRLVLLALLVLLAWGLWWVWTHRFGEPEDFESEEMQFKYGSIGADHPLAEAPLPYWLWKALPHLFDPARVIPDGRGPNNGETGWKAFGLFEEPGVEWKRRGHAADDPRFERPVGFSRRRVFGMDFVGLNCAFCHQGQLRPAPGAAPQHVVGGVGNAVDIEQYFLFLFSALTSKELTSERVMAEVDRQLKAQGAELGWVQRRIYAWVLVPLLPRYLGRLEGAKFDFILRGRPGSLPDFGPGRVDTWSLYKRVFVHPAQQDGISGSSDFPPLWNQKVRTGMRLHWDGNTDVLMERNIISSLSLIGKRIQYLDFERLQRVTAFTEGLLPPRYEDRLPEGQPAIDRVLAARGATVFGQECGRCHSPGGDRFGQVEPIADLGTDPLRFKEFTPELQDALNRLGTRQWQLRNFRMQTGYVNNLLDGIWLRAPYLHNGSVPTLEDLLKPPKERPEVFCRGDALYDWKRLGYVSEPVVVDGRKTCPKRFLYDTTTPASGRGNGGHLYGTSLPAADKAALLEFMKTL